MEKMTPSEANLSYEAIQQIVNQGRLERNQAVRELFSSLLTRFKHDLAGWAKLRIQVTEWLDHHHLIHR